MTDLTVSPSFRNGTYYTLVGTACCACPGGSSIYVFTAVSLRGPWAYRGDAGSNRSQPFDPHSRWNYVTRAQASAVFHVPLAGGGAALVWLGNQWLSGPTRDADLLYWSVLRFGDGFGIGGRAAIDRDRRNRHGAVQAPQDATRARRGFPFEAFVAEKVVRHPIVRGADTAKRVLPPRIAFACKRAFQGAFFAVAVAVQVTGAVG